MNTWAPLWSGIVDSSIWHEEDYIRIVFVTMLAKKDADHIVRGSAFNIAKWSHKTEQEVLDALAVLQAPDLKRLEKQPFDGRRVQKVEDGWLVLNGETYRKRISDEMRKARLRRAQSNFREKHKQPSTEYLDGEDRFVEAENAGNQALADEIASEASRRVEAKKAVAEKIYQAYPYKVGKPAALRAIAKAMKSTPPERLLEITRAFADRKNGDAAFVPHPATWFNQERYNDDPSTWERADQTPPAKKTLLEKMVESLPA